MSAGDVRTVPVRLHDGPAEPIRLTKCRPTRVLSIIGDVLPQSA